MEQQKQTEVSKTLESKVRIYLQACEIQRENAQKNKSINVQKDESKSYILTYMKTNHHACIPIEGKYIVLKNKNTKRAMNNEFLRECFNSFLHKHMNQPPGPLGDRFALFCTTMQTEFSTNSDDIVIEHTIPIAIRLSQLCDLAT